MSYKSIESNPWCHSINTDGMEENLSENKPIIPNNYSTEVSENEYMDSQIPDGDFVAYSYQNPEDCKFSTETFNGNKILLKKPIIGNHSNEKERVCLECGSDFNDIHGLNRNLLAHTKPKQFICDVCTTKCKKSEVQNHSKQTLNQLNKESRPCCRSINTDDMEENLSENRPTIPNNYSTEVSENEYMDSQILDRDFVAYSYQNPEDCKFSTETFDGNKILLKKPIIGNHSNEKESVCLECGRDFNDIYGLNRNLHAHTNPKQFICDVCSEAFTQNDRMKCNLRTHPNEELYICHISDKSFINELNLKTHLNIYSKEKPFVCEICGLKLTRRSELRVHLRIHSNEKPYLCEICGKAFNTGSNLKIHSRIHTNEKPYLCQVCGKEFTQSGHLKSHLRIHTNEKPFVCEICSKAFTTQSHLKRHLRIHTNKKPYICEVCSKAFNRICHLKQHSRIHIKDSN